MEFRFEITIEGISQRNIDRKTQVLQVFECVHEVEVGSRSRGMIRDVVVAGCIEKGVWKSSLGPRKVYVRPL